MTYSGDPKTHARDALRFLLDDTDPGEPQFEDAELDALLEAQGLTGSSQPGDLTDRRGLRAAIEALDILITRFSLQPTRITIGRTTEDRGDALKALQDKRGRLQASLSSSGGAWWAGGISKAEKETVKADTDRVQPAFSRGQFDLPAEDPIHGA